MPYNVPFCGPNLKPTELLDHRTTQRTDKRIPVGNQSVQPQQREENWLIYQISEKRSRLYWVTEIRLMQCDKLGPKLRFVLLHCVLWRLEH